MSSAPRTPRARRLRLTLAAGVATLLCVGAPLAASGVSSSHQLHVDVSVPSVLAAGGTTMWVANTGTGSLLEFNVKTGAEVRNIKGHKFKLYDSDAIALVGPQVWVANAASSSITILNAATGALVTVLSGDTDHFGEPLALAECDNHVFVLGDGGGAVVEFNATSDSVLHVLHGARYHLFGGVSLAVADNHVWVLAVQRHGSLSELDPISGGLVRIVTARAAHLDAPVAMAGDGYDLWVVNAAGEHLSEVDARTGRLVAAPTVAHLNLNKATSIVTTRGRLWLASTSKPNWVACVQLRTRQVLHDLVHRFGFPAVFAGAGHVWVVDRVQSRVTELETSRGAIVRVLVN